MIGNRQELRSKSSATPSLLTIAAGQSLTIMCDSNSRDGNASIFRTLSFQPLLCVFLLGNSLADKEHVSEIDPDAAILLFPEGDNVQDIKDLSDEDLKKLKQVVLSV